MNAKRLNTWLSLTANVGVILGLIFLAVELGQNSDLMRVQINQSRADAAMASNESVFNSDYLPQILIKINFGEELSAEETIRYRAWFRASNRNQDNVLHQYLAGMLGGNSPRSVRDYVEHVIASSNQAREEWENQKVGFTDEFVALVEEVIKATDNQ